MQCLLQIFNHDLKLLRVKRPPSQIWFEESFPLHSVIDGRVGGVVPKESDDVIAIIAHVSMNWIKSRVCSRERMLIVVLGSFIMVGGEVEERNHQCTHKFPNPK